MCEFISWVEKDNKVYFLTHDLVYNTPRGETIQRQFLGEGYIGGHAAIRAYFDLENGTDEEWSDFSSPNYFPSEIVKAIKEGQFRGIGIALQLLSEPVLAEYKKIKQQARAKCTKIIEQARAECVKIERQGWAKYEKIGKQAWAEYIKTEQQAFWDLFAVSENRADAWK